MTHHTAVWKTIAGHPSRHRVNHFHLHITVKTSKKQLDPTKRGSSARWCLEQIKTILLCLAALLVSVSAFADEANLVDERVIASWGYATRQDSGSADDYRKLNRVAASTAVRGQLIRSKQPAPGLKDTYYYFSLTEECFPGWFQAISRRAGLCFRDEKDYRLAFMKGKCVYITGSGANFATFGEQPRIHGLFKEYIRAK